MEHRHEIAFQFFASGCQPAYVLHPAKEPLNKGSLGVDVRIVLCGIWMRAGEFTNEVQILYQGTELHGVKLWAAVTLP
jgi:hypothetical protein